MTIVVTAVDGAVLRKAASGKVTAVRTYFSHLVFGKVDLKVKIARYPENGLTAQEQANWMKKVGSRYDIVITVSPWIISDAKDVRIIGKSEDCVVKFGDSVNKVVMSIWRHQTIGQLALDKIEQLRDSGDIDLVYQQVGDSIERIMLLNSMITKGE